MQLPGRVGEPSTPCGDRGVCSLTSGTCGCFLGYAGQECGECAKGFVRVDEHCAPYQTAPTTSWWIKWFWLILLLALCPCYCCCLILLCLWRRRKKRGATQERLVPHVHHLRDLKLHEIHGHNFMHMLGAGHGISAAHVRPAGFVRPDKLVSGSHLRRASATGHEFQDAITDKLLQVERTEDHDASPCGDDQSQGPALAVSAEGLHEGHRRDGKFTLQGDYTACNAVARRLRQLTRGNSVWQGRRGASVDGALTRTLGYMLEFDDAGDFRQRPEIASCESFSFGTLPALAAAIEPCQDAENGNDELNETVERQLDGDGFPMMGKPVNSTVAQRSKSVSNREHMHLAKQFLKRLCHSPRKDENIRGELDKESSSTHNNDFFSEEMVCCVAADLGAGGGAAVLAAHQSNCGLEHTTFDGESKLVRILSRHPVDTRISKTGDIDVQDALHLARGWEDPAVADNNEVCLPNRLR